MKKIILMLAIAISMSASAITPPTLVKFNNLEYCKYKWSPSGCFKIFGVCYCPPKETPKPKPVKDKCCLKIAGICIFCSTKPSVNDIDLKLPDLNFNDEKVSCKIPLGMGCWKFLGICFCPPPPEVAND